MGLVRGCAIMVALSLMPLGATSFATEVAARSPRVSASDTLRVVLLPATGRRRPHIVSPALAASQTSSLGGDDSRTPIGASIADVAETVPGVHISGAPVGFDRPVLRGLSGARVTIVDNLLPIAYFPWMEDDAPALDARETQAPHVVLQPLSARLGSDAMGGLIYGESSAPVFSLEPRLRARLDSYAASVNREFGSALQVAGADRVLGWDILGIGRSAGDLRTPRARLPHSGFDALNGSAAIGLQGNDGSASLRLVRDGGRIDLTGVRGSSEGDPAAIAHPIGESRDLDDTRVQLRGEYALQGLELETRGQWQHHSLVESQGDFPDPGPPPIGAKPRSGAPIDLRLDRYEMELMAHHLAGGQAGSVGLSGLVERTVSRGRLAEVPDARASSAGGFFAEQLGLGGWRVVLGARADFRHLETDASPELARREDTRDDRQLSGNVGVERDLLSGIGMRATLSRGWRAPTLYEQYARGPHIGAMRFDVGTPSLDPERGLAADFGLRWRHFGSSAELTLWSDWIGDAIELMPTAEIRDSLPVFRFTPARERLSGLEAVLAREFGAAEDVYAFRAEGDVVSGENRDSGAPISQLPPARIALVAETRRGQRSGRPSHRFAVRLEWTARRLRVSEFDLPTASHALLDLDSSTRWPLGGSVLGLELEVRNATNARYRDILSRYRAVADEPGTNVVVRVFSEL